MNVVVTGPVAAALIMAELDLGNSFNLDDGSFNNCEAAIQAAYPNLDKEAVRLLAIVKSAQGLAHDLAKTQAEHIEKCGPDADAIAVFKQAKANKLAQLAKQAKEEKLAGLVKQAEAEAEAEHAAKNGGAPPDGGEEEKKPPTPTNPETVN